MLESYFDEFLVKLVIQDKRTSYTGDKIFNIYEIYVVNIKCKRQTTCTQIIHILSSCIFKFMIISPAIAEVYTLQRLVGRECTGHEVRR